MLSTPSTVGRAVACATVRRPEQPALARAGRPPLAWGWVGAEVRLLALGLLQAGVGPGEAVLAAAPDTAAARLVEWAVLAAGGVLVPLDPDAGLVAAADAAARTRARVALVAPSAVPGPAVLRSPSVEVVVTVGGRPPGQGRAVWGWRRLRAAGARTDAARPDAFEGRAWAVAGDHPAVRLCPPGAAAVDLSHEALMAAAATLLDAMAPRPGTVLATSAVPALALDRTLRLALPPLAPGPSWVGPGPVPAGAALLAGSPGWAQERRRQRRWRRWRRATAVALLAASERRRPPPGWRPALVVDALAGPATLAPAPATGLGRARCLARPCGLARPTGGVTAVAPPLPGVDIGPRPPAVEVGRPLPGVDVATDDDGAVLVRATLPGAGHTPPWVPTGQQGHLDDRGCLHLEGLR